MSRRRMILALLLISILMTGCVRIGTGRIGNMREYTEALEYEELDSLDVRIKMGVGELNVKGGSDQLFQGDFIYVDERWKPRIDYRSSNNRGELTIEHPPIRNVNIGENQYQWNMNLNDEPEMNLELELGVGQTELSLGSFNLNRVDIEMGVGEANIDLRGSWEKDVEVNIQGGIGKAVLELPRDMGVYVEVEGGIGSINAKGFRADDKSYSNDLYGDSKYTMRVNIQAGVGEVVLK